MYLDVKFAHVLSLTYTRLYSVCFGNSKVSDRNCIATCKWCDRTMSITSAGRTSSKRRQPIHRLESSFVTNGNGV